MLDHLEDKVSRSRVYEGLIELSRLASGLAEHMEARIELAGQLVVDCLLEGGKVLACGNGGSAADAQHFVAELVGKMRVQRQSFPAVSLCTDPSVVTALGNDYGYDRVFARQVEGLGRRGDVLLVISTSGHSPNVLRALETAKQNGLRTLALVGEGGDALLANCDVSLHMPSRDTQRVQELHIAVLHAICDYVEQQMTAST